MQRSFLLGGDDGQFMLLKLLFNYVKRRASTLWFAHTDGSQFSLFVDFNAL